LQISSKPYTTSVLIELLYTSNPLNRSEELIIQAMRTLDELNMPGIIDFKNQRTKVLKKRYMRFFIGAIILLFLSACGSGSSNDDKSDTQEEVYHQDPVINEWTQLLKANPQDPELWVGRAEAFYERQGYDEAISDMSNAMRLDSINADYHHFLADIYMDYYKSRLALSTMQRAAVLHPTRIPTLLKLSELQAILAFHKESMETLDKVMRVDPQNPDALLMFGINYTAVGDTARAIGAYQKAVQIDPELVDAWIQLARLRAARKEPNALQFFDAAIRVAPDNVTPRMVKADYLWETDQLDKAIEEYKEVIAIDNSHADAYYNIGLVYLQMEEFEKAHENFDITVKMNPLYFKAFYYRGLASEKMGNLDAALKDYDQSMRMAPGFDKASEAHELLKRKMGS